MSPGTSIAAGRERWKRTLWGALLLGILALLLGIFMAPDRAWQSLFVVAIFLVELALGGAFLMALGTLTNARWMVPKRFLLRGMSRLLPWCALALALTMFGLGTLYRWTDAGFMASDPRLAGKAVWLSPAFFLLRGGLYLVAWMSGASLLWVDPDSGSLLGKLKRKLGPKGSAAAFMIVFAITFSLASFDWLMSMEPTWFSSMFPVYAFAGLMVCSLAGVGVLAVFGERLGLGIKRPSPEFLHALGKMLFTFAFFWGYIWFSQYMLVWFTDMPEETLYFAPRHRPPWLALAVVNIGLNFLIPFVLLLPRSNKKRAGLLGWVAVVMLVGHYLDLYMLVMPTSASGRPHFGLWEAAPILAGAAIFLLLLRRMLVARTERESLPEKTL